jgi:hypothetical protein
MRIRAAGSAANGRLQGTLAEIIYQGNTTRAGVRLASGDLVWAEAPDDRFDGMAVGDAVEVDWDAGAGIILGEDAE